MNLLEKNAPISELLSSPFGPNFANWKSTEKLLLFRRRSTQVGDHVARYVCVQLLDFPLCGLWRSVRFITFFRRFYHKCTHHHDETRNTVNMIASSVQCCRCLLLTAAGGAELHKSSLHVHTVASPSSMHFSAPCIQQARNRTTEKSTWLICKLQ